MELCGGTHARATGEIGLFRIVGEKRDCRRRAPHRTVAGLEAYNVANQQLHVLKNLAGKVNSPLHELEKKIESLSRSRRSWRNNSSQHSKKQRLKPLAALIAKAQNIGATRASSKTSVLPMATISSIADSLKGQFKGVVFWAESQQRRALVATVSPDLTSKISGRQNIQQSLRLLAERAAANPTTPAVAARSCQLDEALAKSPRIANLKRLKPVPDSACLNPAGRRKLSCGSTARLRA